MKTLNINLGIDFGTSFTKVCYRDVGSESSAIVDFSADSTGTQSNWEDAFIPSIFSVNPQESLVTGRPQEIWRKKATNGCVDVRHLKMRLALLDMKKEMKNFQLESLPKEVKNFSSEGMAIIFLANVICESKSWVSRHNPDLFVGREIKWSASVGVPVKIYDQHIVRDRFNYVISRAWKIADDSKKPIETIDEAMRLLRKYADDKSLVDCDICPEIGAAVCSLVKSRSAGDGIYLYFDVGAGTLDGVSFRVFRASKDSPKITFYWGELEPLGVEAICDRHPPYSRKDILNNLKAESMDTEILIELEGEAQKIRELVGPVVMEAKNKDPMEWTNDARHRKWYARHKSGISEFEPGRLGIFMGGGGGDSRFYQESVLSTHKEFGQGRAAIPKYQLAEIPYSEEFVRGRGQVPENELHRFQVAYGLSIPDGERPIFFRPDEVDDIPSKTVKKMRTSGRYDD